MDSILTWIEGFSMALTIRDHRYDNVSSQACVLSTDTSYVMLQVPILMILSGDALREIRLFLAIVNIQRNMPLHRFCLSILSCIKLLLFLPLCILHLIFSHSTHRLPTVSELNGSIPASVPEGGLTLPLHFCSSPSCGAAVGVTKGSLHLRGQPTSSRESGMKSSG